MRLVNQRDGRTISNEVKVARGLFERLRGLMLRRGRPADFALVLPRCRQVHTFLVCFPIDVVYSARDGRVVRVDERVKPATISPRCADAFFAMELPEGTVENCGIRVGDMLSLEEDPE